MNTSAQTHQELAQLRRRVQIFYTAHTVLYAAALGLLVWRPARMAGLVLGVANMVFYFLWLRGQVKGYSNAVTAARTRLGVCAPLADAALTGKGALSGEEFDRWKVAGTEVTLHYPYKNAQGRQDFSFLNGTLLWCEAPAQGDWLLLHKGLLHELAQSAFLVQNGYTAVPLEGTGLDQTFECYSHDGDSALPEYLAHRLEKLAAEAKTLGAVRLCREGTMFYLRDRFYTVTTKVRDLPEEKTLTSNLLPERDEVFSFFRWQQKAKPETEQ